MLVFILVAVIWLVDSTLETKIMEQMGLPTIVTYVGFLLLIFGGLLDFWATKTIGWKAVLNLPSVVHSNDSRKLIVSGPYSKTRNPLYVGDALILLGVFLITDYLILLAMLLAYLIHISVQVRMEENELTEIFGKKYTQYTKKVPRFLFAG